MEINEISNELCKALIDKAINRIENGERLELRSYVLATLDAAQSLQQIVSLSEWTPVTKKLPETDAFQIVTTKDFSSKYPNGNDIYYIREAQYKKGCWWVSGNGQSLTEEVIAWKPKTEPYKGDNADASFY